MFCAGKTICRPDDMSRLKFRTWASVFRQKTCSAFLSRSFRPRKSDRERGSGYLPVHENTDGAIEETKPGEQHDDKPGPDLTGAGTILLVEDEDAVRVFSSRALRNKGYNILEARSGEEALDVLNKEGNKIDLIVSDVVMPQMDGPTLYKHVREKWPEMKVIFVSGYTEDRLREQFKSGETIYFLPKPFTLKQLAGKVKDVMKEE
jgi:two-component system, cell cycle sensor histidine kinase and response regulator CckA